MSDDDGLLAEPGHWVDCYDDELRLDCICGLVSHRLRDELRSEMMERSDAEREVARLRAAIEKLRDDVKDNLHDSDFVLSGWVARRLTEMLEGDFQEQLDRARVKYRGALDELRDK